jgi:hypothetical protein
MILLHAVLGVLIYLFTFYLKYILSRIIIYGYAYYIVSNNNEQQQTVYVAAYLMGSESLLRMTDLEIFFLYEITKCSIIYFVLLAAFFSADFRSIPLFTGCILFF